MCNESIDSKLRGQAFSSHALSSLRETLGYLDCFSMERHQIQYTWEHAAGRDVIQLLVDRRQANGHSESVLSRGPSSEDRGQKRHSKIPKEGDCHVGMPTLGATKTNAGEGRCSLVHVPHPLWLPHS